MVVRCQYGAMLVALLFVGSNACGAAWHRRPVGTVAGVATSRYRGVPLEVVDEAAPAPPGVRVASAPGTAPTSHLVARGETLYSLARRYGTSVERLMQLNGLARPQDLGVGVRLRLPAPAVAVTPRPPVAAPAPSPPSFPSRYVLRWPVQGQITSRFGRRSGRPHDGIDIGAPRGTEVTAAADGEVVFADQHGGYGNLVILRHRGGLMTIYAHHERNLVRKGQAVRRGDPIARVGATGRASGPHLHFEVRQGTRPENPLRFLPP
jgi:lipoprotein NlpD